MSSVMRYTSLSASERATVSREVTVAARPAGRAGRCEPSSQLVRRLAAVAQDHTRRRPARGGARAGRAGHHRGPHLRPVRAVDQRSQHLGLAVGRPLGPGRGIPVRERAHRPPLPADLAAAGGGGPGPRRPAGPPGRALPDRGLDPGVVAAGRHSGVPAAEPASLRRARAGLVHRPAGPRQPDDRRLAGRPGRDQAAGPRRRTRSALSLVAGVAVRRSGRLPGRSAGPAAGGRCRPRGRARRCARPRPATGCAASPARTWPASRPPPSGR